MNHHGNLKIKDVQKRFDEYRKQSKRKTFKLTRGQIVMIEDGAPLCCFLTADERKQAWVNNPPKAMPLMFNDNARREEGEDTKRFRALLEEQARQRTSPPKASRPEKPTRAAPPANSFTLAQLATSNKAEPRHWRAAARKVKAQVEALQVPGHKYTFPAASKAQLVALITSTLAAMDKKPKKPVAKKKAPVKKKKPVAKATKKSTRR